MATKTNTPKTTITLNGEEVTLTNALALEIAIRAMRSAEGNADLAKVADKLEQHLATLTKKPASRTSETAVKNAEDAQKLLDLLPETPFTLAWVAGKMGYVAPATGKANTQKAYKVVEILIKANRVVKVATKSSESALYQLL